MNALEISFENTRCTRVLDSQTFTGTHAARDAAEWCRAAIERHAAQYRADGATVTIFGSNSQSMVTDGGDEAEAEYSFNWDNATAPTVAQLRVRDF